VDVIAPLLVIVALGIVVLIVAAPLRANRARRAADPDEARRADLEAAKEDKYREIRDAEMDFRTGKLSEADWRALDRELRAEAVELLRRVDELGPPG
jgi:flagellar biosynthesis/type III secretory pathway M-ring protein FliF/YscJ